jgi:hypothetical protein
MPPEDPAARVTFSDEPGEQPYDELDIPPDREVVTVPYDPPVKSLLDDIRSKNLIVNPEFQRLSVWDRVRQSRLVESLLLNIPIPVLFFAEDPDGTRVVVDGQQRLRAIEEFEAGQYALRGLQVLPSLNRKRWVDLTPRQARVIVNRTLRCHVISARSDPNLRFEVFERLNTGGVTLNDQELRNSLYRGPFNRFLNELAHDPRWLGLLQRPIPDNRLQHHEMILRFLAMDTRGEKYKPPLKAWLNDFMKDNRFATADQLEAYRGVFQTAVSKVAIVFDPATNPPFRRARDIRGGRPVWDRTLNRPIAELQMLGLAKASAESLAAQREEIVLALARLCVDDEDFKDALSRATADRARTRLRLVRWGAALDELGIPNDLTSRMPAEG